MRVISKKTIKEFYEQALYQNSKEALQSWYKEVIKASWENPNDIKKQYRSASLVENNKVVFNISGNKYRLIVKIHFLTNCIYKIYWNTQTI